MPAISSFVVVVVNIWLVSHVHVQGYKMNDGQVEWVQRKKNVLLWVFVETKGLPTEYIHKEMHWNVQQFAVLELTDENVSGENAVVFT